MPPPGRPRPDNATYHAAAGALEQEIDRAWTAHPDPGRIGAVHRLNRVEYSNAVRDLFGIDPLSLDVKSLLPGDETADGSFDNFADVAVDLDGASRALSVGRPPGDALATGLPPASPGIERFEIPLFVMQDDRQSEDLPLGSRGGIAIRHDFPVDGEYLIKVRLQRQYQDYLKGMGWPQQLDVRLDGKLLKRFTVGGKATGPARGGQLRRRRRARLRRRRFVGEVHAGRRRRGPGASRAGRRPVRTSSASRSSASCGSRKGLPQPLQRGRVIANDQVYMDYANVGSVQIGGPYARPASAAAAEPARPVRLRLAGGCRRARLRDAGSCRRMARLAYRRPVTSRDVQTLLEFYRQRPQGRRRLRRRASSSRSSACSSIRTSCCASTAIRSRRRSVGSRTVGVHRLSDLEVASRLSFFLWSSIPDDRLLSLAERGQLTKPAVLEKEVRRMLADPRADRRAGRQLRRAVAEPAPRRGSGRRSGALSELRPQPAAGLPARDGAVRRQHDPRRPQRRGAAERRLHVRQRAAGAPLRHPRDLRQPVPPRHAAEPRSARRAARARARCWRRRRIRIGRRRCCAASGC